MCSVWKHPIRARFIYELFPISNQKSSIMRIVQFPIKNSHIIHSHFLNSSKLCISRIITHSKDFACSYGNHQYLDPSLLPYRYWLICMGMRQKRFFLVMANIFYSKVRITYTTNVLQGITGCLQVFPVVGKPCNIYRLRGNLIIIMGFPRNL